MTGTHDFLGLVKEFKRYSFGTGQTFNDFNQARDKLRSAHLKVPSAWRGGLRQEDQLEAITVIRGNEAATEGKQERRGRSESRAL